eukprot:366157-Chlamydomonas_euryale.AAC.11
MRSAVCTHTRARKRERLSKAAAGRSQAVVWRVAAQQVAVFGSAQRHREAAGAADMIPGRPHDCNCSTPSLGLVTPGLLPQNNTSTPTPDTPPYSPFPLACTSKALRRSSCHHLHEHNPCRHSHPHNPSHTSTNPVPTHMHQKGPAAVELPPSRMRRGRRRRRRHRARQQQRRRLPTAAAAAAVHTKRMHKQRCLDDWSVGRLVAWLGA